MNKMVSVSALVTAVVWAVSTRAQNPLPPSCDRRIYCNSSLLHQVQMARLFPDSKTFVDMQLLAAEETVLQNFDTLLAETGNDPSVEQLKAFVSKWMAAGDELENWTPPDLVAEPPFLKNVRDPKLRQFGRDLNAIWPNLGRHVRAEVFKSPHLYSLVPVPNGFIIPGGRFKELYYWDSYWIIEGLLVCGMRDTARGMIENLLSLVRLLGHVPNGSRVYYDRRSQPPLLTAMVRLYVDATGDLAWLKRHIETVESELRYWLDGHVVNVGRHKLLRYYALSEGPRPESYREDYSLAQQFGSESEMQDFYTNIKSAAESGWDFSTRWFDDASGGNLSTIRTRDILPVDLNAMFAGALESVGEMRGKLRDYRTAARWKLLAARWRYAIERVLWNDEDGVWYDFDAREARHRRHFYPSNVSPLWANAVEPMLKRSKGGRVLRYLNSPDVELALRLRGIPTSLVQSGEQWDTPNSWPPLQSIMIGALERSGHPAAKSLALSLAQVWVRTNYLVFNATRAMYEKYDALDGSAGGGGEYEVQLGFGWTNGVVLELLELYGGSLQLDDSAESDVASADYYRDTLLTDSTNSTTELSKKS